MGAYGVHFLEAAWYPKFLAPRSPGSDTAPKPIPKGTRGTGAHSLKACSSYLCDRLELPSVRQAASGFYRPSLDGQISRKYFSAR